MIINPVHTSINRSILIIPMNPAISPFLGQANASKSFYLEFSLGDDLFYTENYFYLYPPYKEEKSRVTTYFFTDRSIYRPGQTIYFKGIVLENTGEKSEIKPDFTSVVTFYDANNQKVSELAMTTNEFGSFNGTFTAPSGGLTGEMSIRNESGSVSFSVEEYKRPRFKVEIDPLEGSYKLNEIVNVTGKALNYSGSAVDQAEVTLPGGEDRQVPCLAELVELVPGCSGNGNHQRDDGHGCRWLIQPVIQSHS